MFDDTSEPGAATAQPRVVIGMPLYAPGAALADALSGLLRQTYDDYRLVLVDDASTDAATSAVLERAARDPRVTVRRNPVRLGLAANWAATFRAALELYPDAELFAWAGHHDAWDMGWLAAMVARLDANPRAVLAYPLDARMDADGTPNDLVTAPFSTSGQPDARRRLAAAARNVCAGSAIYALIRVEALERTGGFDRVLRPDRLALAKLALLGEFEQEPRVLWRRRMTGAPTLRRQRAASFPEGMPLAAWLPWPVVHAVVLARWLAGSPACRSHLLGITAIVWSYVRPLLTRDAVQLALDRAYRLEGRLPRRVTALLRRRLGLRSRP